MTCLAHLFLRGLYLDTHSKSWGSYYLREANGPQRDRIHSFKLFYSHVSLVVQIFWILVIASKILLQAQSRQMQQADP